MSRGREAGLAICQLFDYHVGDVMGTSNSILHGQDRLHICHLPMTRLRPPLSEL